MSQSRQSVTNNSPVCEEETQPFLFPQQNNCQHQTIFRRISCRTAAILLALISLLYYSIFFLETQKCKRINPSKYSYPTGGYRQSISNTSGSFAIVGDFQRTSFAECFILGREVNEDDTKTIVKAMADFQPAFVAILGDLVFDGNDKNHWNHLDSTIKPLRETPLLPLLGNHDYCSNTLYLNDQVYCNNNRPWQEFHNRFPLTTSSSVTTWYSRIHDEQLGILWLDSNYHRLTAEQWELQQLWLQKTVENWESDPEIRGIVFLAHHPPYTNSLVVSDDEYVQSTFVPIYCQARKSLAFFTGHAHGFEHFVRDCNAGNSTAKKHFVVTAGGGGPRPTKAGNKYPDLLEGLFQSPRPFHYLQVSLLDESRGIRVQAHGIIENGEANVRLLHEFEQEFPV